MPSVRLSDIIVAKVYQDIVAEDSPEKIALFESGIIEKNPVLDGLANAPGLIAELPFWRDIDADSEPNLSNDDPAVKADAVKIAQSAMSTRKAALNKGFSEMDLSAELAMGDNAMTHIKNRVEAYWARQMQRRLIASASGVMASNVAVGGDMVYNAAANLNSGVTATTLFSRGNFTSAAFTLGDSFNSISAIGVHSIVLKRMVDSGDIEFIRPQEGELEIPYYLGKRVIVDDGMPFTPAGGSAPTDTAAKFTSVLFGYGAFGYGEGTPLVPVAVQRDEKAGLGAGEESLWTRKTWIVHPSGFKVNDVTPSNGISYSLAELRNAATWARVVNRKNVPLAFLVTNG